MRPLALLQPSSAIYPPGVTPNGSEIDLFGQFRSGIVDVIGGPFNPSFWRVDVPTASQVYTTMWHAAVALSAGQQCLKLEAKYTAHSIAAETPSPVSGSPTSSNSNGNGKDTNNSSNTNTTSSGNSGNSGSHHYYVVALRHFHKSIKHLSQLIASRKGVFSYMDKEMMLMTQIMYIGLSMMLADATQQRSHTSNLVTLLEAVRFGEEPERDRSGVMRYDDLLSLVLLVDASCDSITDRWDRDWSVQLPDRPCFGSVTQAYMGFMPLLFVKLIKDADLFKAMPHTQRYEVRRRNIREYAARLDTFEATATIANPHDRRSLGVIRQYLRAISIRENLLIAETRDDVIRGEQQLVPLLDYIDGYLAATALDPTPYTERAPALYFSPSFGSLIILIIVACRSVAIRRKGIELLRKWPFIEGGVDSAHSVSVQEAKMMHELAGPARTLAKQRAGVPVRCTFKDAEGTFDPCQACECIPEVFVCLDHRLGQYDVTYDTEPPTLVLHSWYEVQYGLEPGRYPGATTLPGRG